MKALRLGQRRVFRQLFQDLSASNRTRTQTVSQRLSAPSRIKPSRSSRPFSSSTPSPFTSTRSLRPRTQRTTSRFYSSSTTSSSTKPASEPTSLSARLRKLSREYGWSALGVYLLLSALDFPVCFLLVRGFGTDRIGHLEHVVLTKAKEVAKWPLEKLGWDVGKEEEGSEEVDTTAVDHGVEEAERGNKGDNASIWTQLALAYAIHKSFIFIRVPLTAAVTPKVVKTLRGWGWDIGKRTQKAVKTAATGKQGTAAGTGVAAQKGTGVNTGGKN